MNTKIGLILLILVLHFNLNAKKQEMTDLYKYLIEDYYNESLKYRYLSMSDTLYLAWSLFGCPDDCLDYSIQLDNDKIQFKIPEMDANSPAFSVLRLTMPELDGQFLSIAIIPFSGTYNVEERGIHFVRASAIIYRFKYNYKKSRYELKEKKEYGI